jgi:hypothetical protein
MDPGPPLRPRRIDGGGLDLRRHRVRHKSYCTSGRGDARLFGVLDLAIPDVSEPDFGIAIEIRASNDRSLAIQAVAGVRVFICTNLMMAGESGVVVLRRKHTARLRPAAVVPPAIDALPREGRAAPDGHRPHEVPRAGRR